MFEKSAGRQFDFLTKLQLQTVKIAQIDAISQCFVDFLPVLRCLNHTNLNLYHYAGNNRVACEFLCRLESVKISCFRYQTHSRNCVDS